jgi:hypothetical protein
MSITTIACQAKGLRTGEVIAKLAEDAYFTRVDNRITQVPLSELVNQATMKLPAAVQQMVDTTALVENNHRTPTALGPQLEDPPKAAIAWAAPAAAEAALVAATAAVEVVALVAHHMALVEELATAVVAEAEATRTAMPLAPHVVATTPATELRKYVATRLPQQTTATASPPTTLDFATCSS